MPPEGCLGFCSSPNWLF